MRNFLVPEDRLDQKLAFACSDGRSIEGDLDLWLLARLAGLQCVCHSEASFLPRSVIGF
jgi:hypothetical protein